MAQGVWPPGIRTLPSRARPATYALQPQDLEPAHPPTQPACLHSAALPVAPFDAIAAPLTRPQSHHWISRTSMFPHTSCVLERPPTATRSRSSAETMAESYPSTSTSISYEQSPALAAAWSSPPLGWLPSQSAPRLIASALDLNHPLAFPQLPIRH